MFYYFGKYSVWLFNDIELKGLKINPLIGLRSVFSILYYSNDSFPNSFASFVLPSFEWGRWNNLMQFEWAVEYKYCSKCLNIVNRKKCVFKRIMPTDEMRESTLHAGRQTFIHRHTSGNWRNNINRIVPVKRRRNNNKN